MIGVYFSMQNWMAAGKALVDWLSRREGSTPRRIAA